MSARRVGGPYARGDSVVDVDARLPLQESHAPGVGVFSRPARVHHGRLQCARPVAWLTPQRIGLCTSLDS